jgi:hypothetical protein
MVEGRSFANTESSCGSSSHLIYERAHGARLCPIEIGLDLVMGLHPRRHAETVRVGLEQELALAQRDPDHHRVPVRGAHDQAVMDIPGRTRLGSLALDLGQRLRIPTNLVEGHPRSVGGHARQWVIRRPAQPVGTSWRRGSRES